MFDNYKLNRSINVTGVSDRYYGFVISSLNPIRYYTPVIIIKIKVRIKYLFLMKTGIMFQTSHHLLMLMTLVLLVILFT